MRLLILDVNLFPDRETVERAVAQLAAGNEVVRMSPAPDAGDAKWDQVLTEVRDSDLVITL